MDVEACKRIDGAWNPKTKKCYGPFKDIDTKIQVLKSLKERHPEYTRTLNGIIDVYKRAR